MVLVPTVVNVAVCIAVIAREIGAWALEDLRVLDIRFSLFKSVAIPCIVGVAITYEVEGKHLIIVLRVHIQAESQLLTVT